MVSNQGEAAVDAFKRFLEIDRDSSGGYVNLASCYNLLDKRDEALANYAKAFSLSPDLETGTFINNEYGFLLVRMGKTAEAEATFKKMAGLADNWKKAKGLRSLALLQIYQGKYAAAQENLREAVNVNKSLPNAGLSEYRDHLHLAIALRRKGQGTAFEKELAAMERIRSAMKIEPGFLVKLGTLYARSNKLREADRVLEDMRSVMGDLLAASGATRSTQGDRAAYQRLKGEIELARQKYEEAIGSFKMAGNLTDFMLEDSLALAYQKSGNTDKAIEEYGKFLQKDVLGYEAQELWTLAHYELGMLFEKKGDRAEAAKYYGRFLELWKDADPDIAEVAEAKRRLERLS
jgi:tetratricopeptide (TPR) repeat protein